MYNLPISPWCTRASAVREINCVDYTRARLTLIEIIFSFAFFSRFSLTHCTFYFYSIPKHDRCIFFRVIALWACIIFIPDTPGAPVSYFQKICSFGQRNRIVIEKNT